jgi:type IV secretory pathway VirB2 component (pilin)
MSPRYLQGLVIAMAAQVVTAPASALVSSGTDPSTIIQAALNLILGPIGTGLATLGLIVMLCSISRHGFGGILVYVAIISGIFGSAYVVTQLLGASV